LLRGAGGVSVERLLVVVLAIASTLAAGLAADARGGSRLRAGRLALVAGANGIALPLLAYGLVRLIGLDGAGGLVIAAAAPGGSTGPLLAILARGDAAIAMVLFVVLTLVGKAAALIATMALDVAGVQAVLFASLVVVSSSVGPLLAGLAIRAWRPAIARRWQPWVSRLSLALLVATIALLAARHGDAARAADIVVGLLLTLAALAIGLLAEGRTARIAVAQVSAVRNLTLALLVLAVVGAPPAATMSVLAYGLAMYVITLIAAARWRRS
jgi:bile acid:Na+ symporter, BASS family